MITPSHSNGFSLIEILVSIALLSIMSGIGMSLYAIVNNSYTRANNISKIQSQGSSIMENIERNVRSALSVTTAPSYSCPNGTTECLSLNMPSSSIEYQNSGNCPITEYDWIAPSGTTTNGLLKKAWKNIDGSACNGTAADLFNTDPAKGISVELVNGQSHVFSVTSSATSPDSVLIAMNLTDGVAIGSSRSQVPFITTISLRTYSN